MEYNETYFYSPPSIMSEYLEKTILQTIAANGDSKLANHAYFTFLKSDVYLPIEKGTSEEPRVLFLEQNEHVFLPVFSDQQYLSQWAGDEFDKIDLYSLSGIELLKGLGDDVTLAFNPGTPSYKEFNPEEINKLKTMVVKIQSLL